MIRHIFFIMLLFIFITEACKKKTLPPQTEQPLPNIPRIDTLSKITVNVLVLSYDPLFDGPSGKVRMHQYFSWNNPRNLVQEYVADLQQSSNNFIKFNIVEFREIDQFPVKKDGFVYTQQSYLNCWNNRPVCHSPDEVNYNAIIQSQNVVQLINNKTIDEVWLFGAPYFGFWEAAMAGPKSFYINGGTYPSIASNRAFAIMGFNYERGVAEMLHSNCHRVEATMSKLYGGWQVNVLNTTWAKFAANYQQSNGEAAVGTCHYPPNAVTDYDYANVRVVQSSADDWYNYPALTGAKKPVNRDTWGGPDYHRNYMKWWFHHLPRKSNKDAENKLLNWWKYIYLFNETMLN